MVRVGYLIGQFPAINHHYLLLEIQHLRALGIDVRIASVNTPDRPAELLEPDEQALIPEIYFVKRESAISVAGLALRALLTRPGRFLSTMRKAQSLAKTLNLRRRYGLYYLAEALLVANWARQHGIRQLHASFAASVALLVKELCGTPMSFGVYGFGELYDPVGTQLSRKVQAATFVRSVSGHGVARLMLASPPDQWPKLRHVRLGIDTSEYPPRPQAARPGFELISVGRLAPEKGQRFAITALDRLTSQGRQVALRLVGDGPDRLELEGLVERLGLGRCVFFEGWVTKDRLDALHASASACVLASLYEGIPIVLMEAMARGIPCVAPAVGGIPELIVHESTGLLFAAGDDGQLAEQIARLMDSPALAQQLGGAGRGYVLARYDVAGNTRELAGLFRTAVVPIPESSR